MVELQSSKLKVAGSSPYFWQQLRSEIECQLQLKATGDVAEGFGCDDKVPTESCTEINNGRDFMYEIIEEFVGSKIYYWYVLLEDSCAEWEDGLPFAAFLNAVGPEEIFKTDQYLTEELLEGRNKFFCHFVLAQNGGHVLLLERNEDSLFPNDELGEIITNETYGFKLAVFLATD
ncbi:hypothetical protein FRACYDRAFT_247591 [Fragilariopsis cylindrus CCMP1102]|uniref:Uncharacterized protein n=1 Tax=Fragilariopsis cylindrus CCMP1102 TaxID=635003 RepID=A0A1E7EVH6_9STRA|nr:hypothetical protein FRACYDRAFT_247591 [Fragilariopsis cylindrus CCMP1102]|eukprot:OEU09981.1 hypothetical protein FRACYDRAFT_247591 [Fragilariopsis cylindrus CCMP1102]